MDPDNLTVLRDLAQLQVQMRDLPGYLDSRQTMLEGKPGNRQNWVACAAAHHLCGNHEVAAKVLDSYEATQEEGGGAGEAYERGEVALYKASILEEGGRAGEALAALDSAERAGLVRDRLGAAEARGRLCLSLGRAAEAEAAYRRLLASNVENYKYHDGLRAALAAGAGGAGAGAAAAATLAAAYEALQRAHPHASAPRRIPLDFLEGTEFVDAADAYVRRYLARGIPSLFSDLKPLYADAAKAAALGALFSRLEAALESTGAFPPLARPPAYATGGAAAASPASPQALVWARLYLAQHHDRLGATREALRHVDACLAHTPTLVEAHGVRARVLKHAGDAAGAAAAAQAARAMDLADRYLNGAAAKALFRAGRAAEGEAVVALFTREGDPVGALYEMQATWYEVASGRAYLAAGDRGRALKRFLRVDAHWADFVEDQFDFHAYCTRKQAS
jgi:peptide alpha-N-acetyltransferase